MLHCTNQILLVFIEIYPENEYIYIYMYLYVCIYSTILYKLWKDSYYNFLLSIGNWWKSFATTEEWADDEVYGAETRTSIKTMLLHWKT